MRRVAVFCGSSPGVDPGFAVAAGRVGRFLAESNLGLVFGGGRVGLMGVLADAALAAGGEVIGVIPRSLVEREIAHAGLTELRVVDTMHARKAEMAMLADAFMALPGGAGTLEEIFEVWTWGILGLHAKPCGLLDVGGYFAHLVAFLDGASAAGFLRAEQRAMLFIENDAALLLERFRSYAPPVAKYRGP